MAQRQIKNKCLIDQHSNHKTLDIVHQQSAKED